MIEEIKIGHTTEEDGSFLGSRLPPESLLIHIFSGICQKRLENLKVGKIK